MKWRCSARSIGCGGTRAYVAGRVVMMIFVVVLPVKTHTALGVMIYTVRFCVMHIRNRDVCTVTAGVQTAVWVPGDR